ncbi:MAG: hypothetical protein RLZ98_2348 [Pseudomonadota bacterium]|jgi:uncharacterized protein YdiU (UPF0061 family)
MGLRFDNSYARLPEEFFVRMPPEPVVQPALVRLNPAVAALLGADVRMLESPAWVAVLAGNCVPEGAAPIAMAYAGHQFGNFVPKLGDGRAILLGEVVGPDGVRRDIHLKGAGRTPFSRMGDGRAALGPVIREYVVSEGMAAMGVATTRALAVVKTGETVMREAALPGAVLARVAESHVRVGTFQYFAARRNTGALKVLADYVIGRHYPKCAEARKPYRALLEAVIDRQAALIAKWMGVGFIHGVMNTDNMSIVGETIDFGPCAFMDVFHPDKVYSSIDTGGRYAFANQPRIAHWNLMCLAQAMLPLLGETEEDCIGEAQAALDTFPGAFETAWLGVMRAKLGLSCPRSGTGDTGDAALAQGLLAAMGEGKADFTLTFRRLCDVAGGASDGDASVRELFEVPAAFDAWACQWRSRLATEGVSEAERRAGMRRANPAFIPRNHLVEEVIEAAYAGDFKPFEALLGVLVQPFDDQPGNERYMQPPQPHEVVRQTFCGT